MRDREAEGMPLRCWVASAQDAATDFPLENLPYGVFRHGDRTRIGVAIDDQILDLGACASEGLLKPMGSDIVDACAAQTLNALMSLERPQPWSAFAAA